MVIWGNGEIPHHLQGIHECHLHIHIKETKKYFFTLARSSKWPRELGLDAKSDTITYVQMLNIQN